MRIITTDDIIETYLRIVQRGLSFVLSKFKVESHSRTISSFGTEMSRSGWWMVPEVRKRWNYLITGSANKEYVDYIVEQYLKNKSGLSLLSLGCGEGYHEFQFAKYSIFRSIIGIDLSAQRVNSSNSKAIELGLNNILFLQDDVNNLKDLGQKFNVIMFDNSLHHFKNVKNLLPNITNKYLQDDGILVINEYVGPNRLQWSKMQISETNRALKIIPEKYKIRFKSNSIKNSFSGPGVVRMLISDPSEAVDSISIIPTLQKHYKTIYESFYGGNLLMHILKDTAHHFFELNPESSEILKKLFEIEDELIKKENYSLMMFGIYTKC